LSNFSSIGVSASKILTITVSYGRDPRRLADWREPVNRGAAS
jgi:hypothetical protein